VLLARAVPGQAVRVQWTREDEMCWSPLGPAMLARVSAGLDATGQIVSWRQDVWSNGFMGRPTMGGDPRLLALTHLAGGAPMPPAPDLQPANWMGASRNAVPGYDIPALQVTRHHLLDMPIRTSSLRSLGAHLNVFATDFPSENGDTFVRAVDYINDPQIGPDAARAILESNASALLGIG
jgi:nicotinate dehydrogenase subunit B